ncbi:hypothetical protein Sango_1748100 [Sesamum angolense]|uniref:Uncharacterized protein n=1 Tax=Sesamum angolense TaxID=2727404 RepID=A0AAE1WMQ9_9LAMI|nr:hypothetical protein Sango_1748100 [Sesamum angolense]
MASELNRLGASLSLTEEEEEAGVLQWRQQMIQIWFDLNWWEFHIHIHGLPLGKMTKDIATFIGNKLGRFKDVDLDKNGEGTFLVTVSSSFRPILLTPTPTLLLETDFERQPRCNFVVGMVVVLAECPSLLPFARSLLHRTPFNPTFHRFRLSQSEQAQANPSAKLIPPKPSLEQYRKRGFCWRGYGDRVFLRTADVVGKCGGLVVLWVKSVSAQLPSFSQSHIDLSIQLDGGLPIWRFTGIYEKQGGPLRPIWKIRNFRNTLTECELHDLGCSGDPLTWSSRHTFPNTVLGRLDRACASGSWSQLFLNATIENLPVSCLDHKVLLIRLEDRPTYTLQCSRPCRFEAAWLQSEQCEDIVAASWGSSRGLGGSLEVASKLASCQQILHWWSRDVFRADKGRLKFLENRLKRLLAGSLTEWIQEEISRTRKELKGLAARAETVWRQRSKDTWLREGDRNTSFFHQRASNRFHTNQIHKIKNF